MRKILLCLAMLGLSTSVMAGPYWHHHRPHSHNHWIAPIVIGGVVGAVIANQSSPVPPPPMIIYNNQIPAPPIGYYYGQLYDASCYCYRLVLIPNY